MKKYQIIYADPPWAYNSKRSNYINNGSGETLRHYDTLTIDELKEMPVRDKIVELCGDVSRVELFARKQTEGWDTWGNEVEITNEDLKYLL